ncbi:MAG: Twitching motility protein PilT [Candidatus Ozemobacter sibiricus]|jgi:twitching motility protein PilT|uniref:Twitching motility protein PilT n=1 Tax=Candidatus Ozemobacter sibiricus TaxID=2268124 RepID=A0A367ZUI5_9BACT|nr:MAG: Twitching motility protein PilT [Candidatus Ozemobacter sibiricus]
MDEQLAEILSLCKKMGASDVHLRAGLPPVYRVGGRIQLTSGLPLTNDTLKRFFEKTAPPVTHKMLETQRDVDYSVSLPGVSRFRVNCFYQKGHLAFVFRQIPFTLPTIDSIKLPKVMVDCVQRSSGLFLLCGPTGSGKSTTIAALLQFLNSTYQVRVVTLEDPIEFLFRDEKCEFLQRELRRDFTSFPEALRGTLRQDPDIIMVGEMRETETIELALTAAETGHLVISTLHASSTASAIARILGVFPADAREFIRDQVASVLIGIVAQALIPSKRDPAVRVAAREILINNPAIANLIRNDKHEQIPMFLETGTDVGMISMNAALEDMVVRDVITPDQAFPYSPDPEALLSRFERKGLL